MKKYILSILVLVTVILATVGCSSHSGFGEAVKNGSIPQNITVNKNGGIASQEPFPGFKIQCDDGTFASNDDIELIIVEEPTGSAGGTSLLKSSSSIYSVRAIKTSTNEEVNAVFKPIKITLHNSSDSDEVYIGITTDKEGLKWNYVPYNGPVAGALRLSSNVDVEITYDMFKLGSKVGLFAPEKGKTVTDAPIVSYLNIGDKDNEISIKDSVYTENLVLNLALTGANLSKVDMNKDCIVRFSYPVSDKNAEKITIVGGTANSSDSESKSGATGNSYVRIIEITGLTEVAQPLGGQLGAVLTLNLKELSTSVFPKNFNIEVINTNDSANFKELPFCVTTSVELKEKASPSTSVPVPTIVAASYNTASRVISVDWEWSGTDENAAFEVSILNTSLEGATPDTFTVGNVRKWDSSNVDLALRPGDYSVSVVAISNGEKSEAAEKAQAFTVPELGLDTLSAPVITALPTTPYTYGSDVTVEWSASEFTSPKGNTGTVKYAVYMDTNSEPATEIAKDLTTTSYKISAADLLKTAGKYYVKVVATCNALTADSTKVEAFEVAQIVVGTPVITSPTESPFTIGLGNEVTIEWTECENASFYDIYTYTGSDMPTSADTTVIGQLSCGITFVEAGTYNVVVEAVCTVNGRLTAKSEVMEISVVDITPKNVQATGDSLCLASSWEAGSDISGITYYVSVKDGSENEVISSYTSKLSCNIENCLENNVTYIFEVSAKIGSSYSASATVNFTAKVFWEGQGTEDNPYLVPDAFHLDHVRDFLDTENVYFKQTQDIDLTEYIASNYPDSGWDPIGSKSNSFKGSYNGNNKKISGLSINRTSGVNVGLFGYCNTTNGSLRNIIIIKPIIKGSMYVGALVGASNTNICQCCIIDGDVEGTSCCGLLVGWPNCHIDQCFTSGGSVKIIGSSGDLAFAGGLAGYTNSLSTNMKITNCYSSGVTIYCDTSAAGLLGESYFLDFEISNSYSANIIIGNVDKAAFVHYSRVEPKKISNCFTTEEESLPNGCEMATTYDIFLDLCGGTEWDDDIWDLSRDLPTLKWYDKLNY